MSAPAKPSTSTVTCARCGRRNRVPAVGASVPKCGNCHQPLPWIAEAGDDDFVEVAEQAPVPALVDLWASWCRPCRLVSPALEELATDRAGTLKLVKVEVDAAPRLSQRFAIRAVPTLLVMRGGKVLASQAGAASEPVLRRWLDGALSGSGER